MNDNGIYHERVKNLTEKAARHIEVNLDGRYNGYTGANAVSMYLNDNHGINVTSDNTAQHAFEEALSE